MQIFQSNDPYYFDENKWVNDLYDQLKIDIEYALLPLDIFLKQFDNYKEILKIKPDEYLKKVESDEKPKEIEQIRDEINEFVFKEKKLRESMPESVQVGFFKVNCKEIVSLLAGKYLLLSKGLIDVMAKRARS
jgi:dynein heavy chain